MPDAASSSALAGATAGVVTLLVAWIGQKAGKRTTDSDAAGKFREQLMERVTELERDNEKCDGDLYAARQELLVTKDQAYKEIRMAEKTVMSLQRRLRGAAERLRKEGIEWADDGSVETTPRP